jgi:uncharacterized protein involved in exopolysaccharide biosynthesis
LNSARADDVSLVGLMTPILRHRDLIARVMAVVFLGVVLVAVLRPRSYSGTASFMPQSRRMPSSLAGLAGQFGFALPLDEPTQSPAFYVDLVTSREILGAVVDSQYTVPTDSGPSRLTLVQVFRSRGRDEAQRRYAAIKRLRRLVTVSAVQRTGVVALSVEARYPSLAAQVTSRILEELNRFNLSTRQTRAAAERRFTEQRLQDVQAELRGAEDQLQRFLQRNRDYRNSPVLVFEQERLAREVSMKQQLYTTLAQAVEQAKIDEVRDTPVITIIERPEIPVRPDSRGLIKKGIVAVIIGGIIGVLLAFTREVARNTAADDSQEGAQFVKLKREAGDDLRHPLKAIGRLLGFGSST